VESELESSSKANLLDPDSVADGRSNQPKLEREAYKPKTVGSVKSRAMRSVVDAGLAIVCISILAFAVLAARADGNKFYGPSYGYYPYEQQLLDTARIVGSHPSLKERLADREPDDNCISIPLRSSSWPHASKRTEMADGEGP
jgi:hypothetical protein